MANEFDYSIVGQPNYSYLSVQLSANQQIKAEAAAMISMDTNVAMSTKIRGGLSRVLGGENLFLNEFIAENMPGNITFAPSFPGDITHIALNGEAIYVQSGGYLASGPNVNVETKWQGMVKGFFSGAGLFLLKCSGEGDIFVSSYGGIMAIDVDEEYIVDTSHIVGFTEGLEYKLTTVSGYKSLFFSGEGLVARFTGKGRIWVQTHQLPYFMFWIWPFRPEKKDDS